MCYQHQQEPPSFLLSLSLVFGSPEFRFSPPRGSERASLLRCFGFKMLLLCFSELELISQLLITRILIFKFVRVVCEVLGPV